MVFASQLSVYVRYEWFSNDRYRGEEELRGAVAGFFELPELVQLIGKRWFKTAGSRAAALRKPVDPTVGWIEIAGKPHRFGDGLTMDCFSLWNGEERPAAASVSGMFGVDEPTEVSEVTVSLPLAFHLVDQGRSWDDVMRLAEVGLSHLGAQLAIVAIAWVPPLQVTTERLGRLHPFLGLVWQGNALAEFGGRSGPSPLPAGNSGSESIVTAWDDILSLSPDEFSEFVTTRWREWSQRLFPANH